MNEWGGGGLEEKRLENMKKFIFGAEDQGANFTPNPSGFRCSRARFVGAAPTKHQDAHTQWEMRKVRPHAA